MRRIALVATLANFAFGGAWAQLADPQADVSVARPAFSHDAGPVVAIDSGHHNYHTIDGRYAPLALVLRNDGYRMRDSAASFTAESLANIQVLIVSNALAASNAVLHFGMGRIVVFGEAAMFSAQVIDTPGRPPFRFGFNAPTAKQNKQFVLNVVHWLSGVLPD